MNILVTAGSTQAPIDRVRCVTAAADGRAGAAVARTAWGRGHSVTLATSQPDALTEYGINPRAPDERLTVLPYQTFDDLAALLSAALKATPFDAVVHAAEAGDFLPAGTYAPAPGTYFNARTREWEAAAGRPSLADRKEAKIKVGEPELWVRLVRAPNLLDRFRPAWAFAGVLVPFEQEAGVGEDELVGLADAARRRVGADLVVATTLDGAAYWAYLGPLAGRYDRVPRRELPDRVVLAVERAYQERGGHGERAGGGDRERGGGPGSGPG